MLHERAANLTSRVMISLALAILCFAGEGDSQTSNGLFGFYFSSTPDLQAARIDPATGLMTTFGAVPATGFLLGATAYDPVHRVEYIGRNATTLLVFNVDSGVTTMVPLSQSVEIYAIDEIRGILYGLGFNGVSAEVRSINVGNGVVTSITPVSAAGIAFVPGTETIDPFGSLLFYGDGTNLIEVNISARTSRAIAVSRQPQLLVFDRSTRQLFAFVFGTPTAQIIRIDSATG